jgi:UDP:flavonoid glycosyltransferase YjiC (YdhE family)
MAFWKATPTSVALAMQRARADQTLRRAALEAAAALSAEDGVVHAVRLIEQLRQ